MADIDFGESGIAPIGPGLASLFESGGGDAGGGADFGRGGLADLLGATNLEGLFGGGGDAGGGADFGSGGFASGLADAGAAFQGAVSAPFDFDGFASQITAVSTGGASTIAQDFSSGVQQLGQGFGFWPAIDLSSTYLQQTRDPIDVPGAGPQIAKVAPSSGNGIWGSIPPLKFPFSQSRQQQGGDYTSLILLGVAVVLVVAIASGGKKK